MASLLKAKHQKTALKMAEGEGLKIARASLAKMESTCFRGQQNFILISARVTCVLMIMQTLKITHLGM